MSCLTLAKKTTHDPTFDGGWELREENVDEIPCVALLFLSFPFHSFLFLALSFLLIHSPHLTTKQYDKQKGIPIPFPLPKILNSLV